jgi:hypothetical protein
VQLGRGVIHNEVFLLGDVFGVFVQELVELLAVESLFGVH